MAIAPSLTCVNCHQKFSRKEIVNFNGKNLCFECHKEASEKNAFDIFICQLFGLKKPGPKIYSQRKNLLERGYSLNAIRQTLDYLFNIKGLSKKEATIGILLTNPEYFDEAKEYYRKENQNIENWSIAAQEQAAAKRFIVPIRESVKEQKKINLDEINWD